MTQIRRLPLEVTCPFEITGWHFRYLRQIHMHSSLSMIVAVTEKSVFLTEKSYPSVRRQFLWHQGVVRSRGEGTG